MVSLHELGRDFVNMKIHMGNKNKVCEHDHHSVIPVLFILFAISFLLQYQGILAPHSIDIIWPILVGVGGMVMLIEDKCGCC
jgi:hypothetical protein